MSEFAARVGRVRMKAGGADFRVLRSKPGLDGKMDWRGAMVANAREIAEQATEARPLTGYVVMGIFGDGTTNVGYRYDYDAMRAIPRMLVPAWVAEVLRRDLITEPEAKDTFHEMFEWKGP